MKQAKNKIACFGFVETIVFFLRFLRNGPFSTLSLQLRPRAPEKSVQGQKKNHCKSLPTGFHLTCVRYKSI